MVFPGPQMTQMTQMRQMTQMTQMAQMAQMAQITHLTTLRAGRQRPSAAGRGVRSAEMSRRLEVIS